MYFIMTRLVRQTKKHAWGPVSSIGYMGRWGLRTCRAKNLHPPVVLSSDGHDLNRCCTDWRHQKLAEKHSTFIPSIHTFIALRHGPRLLAPSVNLCKSIPVYTSITHSLHNSEADNGHVLSAE